ncbi:MAG: PEP-CTERM sorting domain-containing protein [Betaproteobacteria bacterium]|nr:PEP-CTERM sorting domain-containing protein [Betaproteobacteria bacterium]
MSSNETVARARVLAGRTALCVLPLAAAAPAADAATLLHDYSLAGEYSGSGWFMTGLDESAADAAPQGNGLKLTGNETVDDGLFWRWDNFLQATVRRYDVSGIAFAWGGAIDGVLNPGDIIDSSFDFVVDFTHTLPAFPAYDYTYLSWELRIGLRSSGYTPGEYQSLPGGDALDYVSAYGSADAAGNYRFQNTMQFEVGDWAAPQATDWFATLTFDWADALARQGYEDTQGAHNGDTLSVTVPDRSIDVAIVPTSNTQPGQTLTNSGGLTVASSSTVYTQGTLENTGTGEVVNEGSVVVTETGLLANAGTIRNRVSGWFGVAGTLDNGERGVVENAGALEVMAGGAVLNSGALETLGGASFDNAGTVGNGVSGLFGLAGSMQTSVGGTVENAGNLAVRFNGLFGSAGTVENASGGVIDNDGEIRNELRGLFGNAGTIENRAGALFENSGTLENRVGGLFGNAGSLVNESEGTIANSGTLNNLFGASVNNRGTFVNSSAHTVNNDGEFRVEGYLENTATGVFHNDGTLEITGTGEFDSDGLVTNAGEISNAGVVYVSETGEISGPGSFLQTDGFTQIDGILAAGEVRVDGGEFGGWGSVASTTPLAIADGATLLPGGDHEVGTLTIDGSLVLSPASTVVFDLFGTEPGVGHDVLSVLGSARLAGDLVLTFGFSPVPGSMITVLDASLGVTGNFSHVYADGRDVVPVYGTNSVSLRFAAPVPEPSTYGLFLAGLGLAGTVRLRRRT